jgi:hypothetical protein
MPFRWASADARGLYGARAQPILLIDEVDVIDFRPGWEEFGHGLRSILSDPSTYQVRCAAAGYRPPWMMRESDPHPLSPWWDLFLPVRLAHFGPEEVREFCQWLGADVPAYADIIWSLTGGSPALVARIGYEYLNGQRLSDLIANPLDGPLAEFFLRMPFISGLGTDQKLMRALRDGKKVPKEVRTSLWLAGLVEDQNTNPPVIVGTGFRDMIFRLADE